MYEYVYIFLGWKRSDEFKFLLVFCKFMDYCFKYVLNIMDVNISLRLLIVFSNYRFRIQYGYARNL